MTAVATRYGFMEIIESDSTVSKSLSLYGEWAQKELDLLARFILPGVCVLDVGAFIGTHTLAFAQMVGATGKVYAFEPRREIFTYLQRNIKDNGLEQVNACNLALGAQPATLAMDGINLMHAANFGGLGLSMPRDMADGEAYFVSVVTLDSLELPAVDLVKLDVEGMEADVLAGGGGLIARDRPVIFAECNSLDGGAPLVDFARANAYHVFGGMSDAYNAANFNQEAQNIFGPAKELGLLLLPAEKLETYRDALAETGLPEVESFDDLSCLLLSKPQYYGESLAQFCAKHEVWPALPSHELDEALAAKGRCEAALSAVKELAFARQNEIIELSARLQTENIALNEAQRLAFERLDEVNTLKAQLEAMDTRLSDAQSVNFEQHAEILAKSALLKAKTVAKDEAQHVATSRSDEIVELQAQLADLRRELQTLEDTRIVRTLRGLGLLKPRK